MKLTTLILFFSTFSGLSQEIKYNLFLKDSCLNRTENSLIYHLEKNGIEYHISDFDGTIILPSKGNYKLIATELDEEHNIVIDNLINSDTLTFPKIREIISIDTSLPNFVKIEGIGKINPAKIDDYIFVICKEKCNGIETDYYASGKVRLKAEFRNGLVIGELKRYYQSGNIKEISIYDKDGVLTKRTLFSENGEIKKE